MKAEATASELDVGSEPAQHHVLPPLPYGYSALETCIDTRTMALHHDKHHAGYVDKLNELVFPHRELRTRSASWLLLNDDSIPKDIRSAVLHNAGGHYNHSLLWQAMSPSGGVGPTGALAATINAVFGSLREFQTRFEDAGATLFGSGWVWLVIAQGKQASLPRLEIVTTSGHDNPIQQGQRPLLVNDVWEHAYYLRYENKRSDYLKSWWSIVNWKDVVRRFEHPDRADESELANISKKGR